MAASKEKKSEKSALSETSVKVGKALARSSHKVEQTGQKIRKAAEKLAKEAKVVTHRIEESVDETVGKVKKEMVGLGKKKPAAQPGSRSCLFNPAKGMSVEICLGFLAGDVYQHLQERGGMPVSALCRAMEEKGAGVAMVSAALGWLAREAKISFSKDGAEVSAR